MAQPVRPGRRRTEIGTTGYNFTLNLAGPTPDIAQAAVEADELGLNVTMENSYGGGASLTVSVNGSTSRNDPSAREMLAKVTQFREKYP